ncbi:MAG: NYN domain-containing protein [Candidatus Omnitrophica bacterium]|nr:NYN domain-containing protein [Candidatus Omnitrophota bacterium]
MPQEPSVKRAFAFFDGQNLFHSAKESFGYTYPNFAPRLLAEQICSLREWNLEGVFFYTGIPDAKDDSFWNHFWTAKLAVMGTRRVQTFSRSLRYRFQRFVLPDGKEHTQRIGQEKGIDIRIALDVVRLARTKELDVALIFSQDQDLSEVADEVKQISMDQNRWIKVACAFPVSPTTINRRGINGTDWIPIDRVTYDSCLDSNDYRPKTKG